MTRPRILVVGSANIDLVAGAPRCPRPGESIIGRSFKTVTGGKGANQAVAAGRLGAQTFFAGCVGNDSFGQMQRATLTAAGVNITHLKSDAAQPTGTALICVGDDGQNSIVIVPAANSSVRPSDVEQLEDLMPSMDAVLLQLEIPLDTVEAVLDMAGDAGVLTIVDAGPAQKVPQSIIRKAAILSPNETEAEAMTGIPISSVEDARRAANALMGLGATEVVMKLGANGCLYVGEDEVYVPAFAVRVVDTTAAGDAFTAALACAWDAMPRRSALAFANAAGGLAATVAGAQPSMPKRESVNAFLRERGETAFE
ncbi:MAG: ribokinase [Candidatus Hydrogenedentes bacterium]|nr:ribokinase [Candidatus Hydrogenedentota bacterium]